MGTQNMFTAMVTETDLFHKLMGFAANEMIRCLRWQEENGLIMLNNNNDYMGSGSYCFTDELPQQDFNGVVRSRDTWGHINSQESVGMSPAMFDELVYPYYAEIAQQFGLVYYGCCEPVHDLWLSISKLPNLRKISISNWCAERQMADYLQGKNIIYSRKPSPNYLGITQDFDEDAFTDHIKLTTGVIGNLKSEFIFRDIYKLHGNIGKINKAVDITRRLTEGVY